MIRAFNDFKCSFVECRKRKHRGALCELVMTDDGFTVAHRDTNLFLFRVELIVELHNKLTIIICPICVAFICSF